MLKKQLHKLKANDKTFQITPSQTLYFTSHTDTSITSLFTLLTIQTPYTTNAYLNFNRFLLTQSQENTFNSQFAPFIKSLLKYAHDNDFTLLLDVLNRIFHLEYYNYTELLFILLPFDNFHPQILKLSGRVPYMKGYTVHSSRYFAALCYRNISFFDFFLNYFEFYEHVNLFVRGVVIEMCALDGVPRICDRVMRVLEEVLEVGDLDLFEKVFGLFMKRYDFDDEFCASIDAKYKAFNNKTSNCMHHNKLNNNKTNAKEVKGENNSTNETYFNHDFVRADTIAEKYCINNDNEINKHTVTKANETFEHQIEYNNSNCFNDNRYKTNMKENNEFTLETIDEWCELENHQEVQNYLKKTNLERNYNNIEKHKKICREQIIKNIKDNKKVYIDAYIEYFYVEELKFIENYINEKNLSIFFKKNTCEKIKKLERSFLQRNIKKILNVLIGIENVDYNYIKEFITEETIKRTIDHIKMSDVNKNNNHGNFDSLNNENNNNHSDDTNNNINKEKNFTNIELSYKNIIDIAEFTNVDLFTYFTEKKIYNKITLEYLFTKNKYNTNLNELFIATKELNQIYIFHIFISHVKNNIEKILHTDDTNIKNIIQFYIDNKLCEEILLGIFMKFIELDITLYNQDIEKFLYDNAFLMDDSMINSKSKSSLYARLCVHINKHNKSYIKKIIKDGNSNASFFNKYVYDVLIEDFMLDELFFEIKEYDLQELELISLHYERIHKVLKSALTNVTDSNNNARNHHNSIYINNNNTIDNDNNSTNTTHHNTLVDENSNVFDKYYVINNNVKVFVWYSLQLIKNNMNAEEILHIIITEKEFFLKLFTYRTKLAQIIILEGIQQRKDCLEEIKTILFNDYTLLLTNYFEIFDEIKYMLGAINVNFSELNNVKGCSNEKQKLINHIVEVGYDNCGDINSIINLCDGISCYLMLERYGNLMVPHLEYVMNGVIQLRLNNNEFESIKKKLLIKNLSDEDFYGVCLRINSFEMFKVIIKLIKNNERNINLIAQYNVVNKNSRNEDYGNDLQENISNIEFHKNNTHVDELNNNSIEVVTDKKELLTNFFIYFLDNIKNEYIENNMNLFIKNLALFSDNKKLLYSFIKYCCRYKIKVNKLKKVFILLEDNIYEAFESLLPECNLYFVKYVKQGILEVMDNNLRSLRALTLFFKGENNDNNDVKINDKSNINSNENNLLDYNKALTNNREDLDDKLLKEFANYILYKISEEKRFEPCFFSLLQYIRNDEFILETNKFILKEIKENENTNLFKSLVKIYKHVPCYKICISHSISYFTLFVDSRNKYIKRYMDSLVEVIEKYTGDSIYNYL